MQLLTFAHKNEAQVFLQQAQFSLVKDFSNFYFNGSHYLLITGEGLWESFTQMMHALNYFKNSQSSNVEIINFGAAGALRAGMQLNTLYSIRTCYALPSSEQMEFHSYSSTATTEENMADCLSSYQRTIDPNEKNRLAPFAALVDRELWAIARACHEYNVNWRAYKIVSDLSEEITVCESVKTLAHQMSQQFYLEWQKINAQSVSTQLPAAENILEPFLQAGFAFTFTQKHQAIELLQKIILQQATSSAILCENLPLTHWQKLKPKERTQQLIYWLRIKLTPELAQHASAISLWLTRWKTPSIELQMSQANDYEYLEVKFKSHALDDWKKTLDYLNSIPRQELENILQGKY